MAELTKTEELIISESPKINIGENIWLDKVFSAFPALKYRNYRLYFSGQLISFIGSWLQGMAMGWLVLKLSNSALWVGTINALGSIPVLFFALFGGVLVDKFNRKKVLMTTQSLYMLIAMAIAVLVITNKITITWLAVFSFISGVVSAIDSPANSTLVSELVNKKDLPSAFGLNSAVFNAARIVGPTAAGLLISAFGIGTAFALNAFSFVAILIALPLIKTKPTVSESHTNPAKAVKEGLRYAFSHPILVYLLIFASLGSVFCWSIVGLMPVIAVKMLHQDAAGLGYLMTGFGIGALLASLTVSAFSKKLIYPLTIVGGNLLFDFSILLFSFTSSMKIAFPLLMFAGFGLVMQFSSLNSRIQQLTEDKYRGRISSIYTLMFMGLSPIGSFLSGFLADHFSVQLPLKIGITITMVYSFFLLVNLKKISRKYNKYSQKRAELAKLEANFSKGL